MRIVLSGGGTAGHINPALALAEELTERGHEVFYAGTPNGVEARLVPMAGIPFQGFESQGFDRAKPTSLIKGVRKVMKSTTEVTKWFLQVKPDLVVAFGGYVCLPVGRAAMNLRVPLIVHEQNSVMGMSNRYLAEKAQAVAVTYPESTQGTKVSDSAVVVTGNPVRSSILSTTREEGRAFLGVPEDATLLVVFGGSLGARHINQAMVRLKDDLLGLPKVHVVHITGPKEYDDTLAALNLTEEEARRYQVIGYQDHMAETLAAADVVVSRAGATSLAEISALRIPAVLVPYPHATADHQTRNAASYVDRGAAYLVDDERVESDEFKLRVLTLVIDPMERASMQEAAATFETESAAKKLADLVEEIKEETTFDADAVMKHRGDAVFEE